MRSRIAAQEEEEKEREEAERRQREEAERLAKLEEVARKQREKEAEIEEKKRREREALLNAASAPAAASKPAEADGAAIAPMTGAFVPPSKRSGGAHSTDVIFGELKHRALACGVLAHGCIVQHFGEDNCRPGQVTVSCILQSLMQQ
jgi:hypothetical protein